MSTSTFLYDRALVEKLKHWTSGRSSITVLGANELGRLIEIQADTINGDKPVELPLITVNRGRGFAINLTSRRPLTYDGKTLDATLEMSKIVNAVPITISYQIDVYTRKAEECDLLISNLIFNIINYPGLTVAIPNSHGRTHTATIQLENGVDDNSDIPEAFVKGNMTRMSLTLAISDAYLWDARDVHNVSIDIDLDSTEDSSPIEAETNKQHKIKFTNGVTTLFFEPYENTEMTIKYKNGSNWKTITLKVGKNVTATRVNNENRWALTISNKTYAKMVEGKECYITYVCKEISRYVLEYQNDTSLAQFCDEKYNDKV